jgi:HSP20 family molecular chaperone IbpA
MDHDDSRAEFERLFGELMRRPHRGRFAPNADVVLDDGGERLLVQVEIAGADASALRIFVDARQLIIAGRRGDAARLRQGSLIQKEIEYGEFVKKIHLPVAVQYGDVTATYGDGMLTIVLPVAQTEYVPTARTEIRLIIKRTLV